MSNLAAALFGIIASTLAGTFVVVALVAGVTGLWSLLGMAALGTLVAVPISVLVARGLGG